MKIIKHKVSFYRDGKSYRSQLHTTKERAIANLVTNHFFETVYKGEVEIDLHCGNCGKELNVGDEYIKVDEYTRYCSDCYEEETITYYIVDGVDVGNENETELYDKWNEEGEVSK